MRGDPHTPPVREPELSLRAERRAAAAAAALLFAALFTGGASSPFVPLLIPPLLLFLRFATRRVYLFAPVACAVALLAVSVAGPDLSLRAAIGAVAVLASGVAGMVWRRESKRSESRLGLLDDILAQSQRSGAVQAHTAADELAELGRALASQVSLLGASDGTVWAVDGHAGTAQPRASTGTRINAPVRLAGDPLGWAWEQGMRLRLNPTPRWAVAGTLVVAEQLRRTEAIGDVVAYTFPADATLPPDAAFDQAAVYLRAILALQEARAGAAAGSRRVAALLQGLRRIPGELELEPLARDLGETAMSVTDATGALVGVWDGERGEVLAVTGADGGPRPGDTFELPRSELALAIRADTMLARNGDEWTLGRTSVATPDERWLARPRSLATLPLRGTTRGVIGVLAVWSSRARSLDRDALELLYLMSPYAALHLEHAHAFGRLRETAERDPLTGLRNRRAFDDIFATESIRFERYGRPLALLMLDIDHFKAVNDRFGHEAGDEVLRRVARLIAGSVRDADTVGRLGGEEFVVLLPETGVDAAADVAERIRLAVRDLYVDWRGTAIPLTLSIGVSATPERVHQPRDLISSADAALYRAKSAGRDRVDVA